MSTTAGVPTTEPTTQPVQRHRSRPLTEYWDFRAARWRTAPPVPAPRQGD